MKRKRAGLIMLVISCMVLFCAMRVPVMFEQDFQETDMEQAFLDEKYSVQDAYLASVMNVRGAKDMASRKITGLTHTRQMLVFQPYLELDELSKSFSGRLAVLLLMYTAFLRYAMCQLRALQRMDGKKRELLL